jgi:hypothetical protein
LAFSQSDEMPMLGRARPKPEVKAKIDTMGKAT